MTGGRGWMQAMWRRRARPDAEEEWAAFQRRCAADLDRFRARIAELHRQLVEIGPDLHGWEMRDGQLRRKDESEAGPGATERSSHAQHPDA